MKWFKRILKGLAALAALALLVFVGLIIYVNVAYNVDYPNTPKPAIVASKDPSVIARGEYLVHAVAHCSTCHGPADLAQQHLVDFSKPLVGGWTIDVWPFGTFQVRNITPDTSTGIGGISDGELARVVRHGVDRRGKLSPIMRIAVGAMSDEDLTAIISWLRAQPAVEAKRGWYDLAILGKVVMLDLRPRTETPPPFVPEGEISVARGKYLAEGPAACAVCHTPRDPLEGFAPKGPLFSGEDEADEDMHNPDQEIVVPNLTPDPTTGHITTWTEDAFVARFKTGRTIKGSKMPWDAFQRMTENDVRSLYRFLKSLAPVKHRIGPTVRRK